MQDQKVREARAALDAFTEDHVVLTSHMHMARFAQEAAERDLAAAKAQREAVRSDWQRKLQDCRKEVHCYEGIDGQGPLFCRPACDADRP